MGIHESLRNSCLTLHRTLAKGKRRPPCVCPPDTKGERGASIPSPPPLRKWEQKLPKRKRKKRRVECISSAFPPLKGLPPTQKEKAPPNLVSPFSELPYIFVHRQTRTTTAISDGVCYSC